MRQSNAKISILDRGFCYGDGLFETIRVNKGKIYLNRIRIRKLHRIIKILPIRAFLVNFLQEYLMIELLEVEDHQNNNHL